MTPFHRNAIEFAFPAVVVVVIYLQLMPSKHQSCIGLRQFSFPLRLHVTVCLLFDVSNVTFLIILLNQVHFFLWFHVPFVLDLFRHLLCKHNCFILPYNQDSPETLIYEDVHLLQCTFCGSPRPILL